MSTGLAGLFLVTSVLALCQRHGEQEFAARAFFGMYAAAVAFHYLAADGKAQTR